MISIIITGIDDYEKYTLPLLNSIKLHEPDCKVVLIDNGSKKPYPCDCIRLDKTVGYASAINIGMDAAGDCDWYVVLSNDILVTKPFSHKLDFTGALAGFNVHNIFGNTYLQGWTLFISREVWNAVGRFDEKFAPMYFEDADYCFRAIEAGFKLLQLDAEQTGLYHFWEERQPERISRREKLMEAWERNRDYVMKKHNLKPCIKEEEDE